MIKKFDDLYLMVWTKKFEGFNKGDPLFFGTGIRFSEDRTSVAMLNFGSSSRGGARLSGEISQDDDDAFELRLEDGRFFRVVPFTPALLKSFKEDGVADLSAVDLANAVEDELHSNSGWWRDDPLKPEP